MQKNTERIEECIERIKEFRANIPANLTIKKVRDVWGVKIEQKEELKVMEPRKNIIDKKIKIARISLEWLVIKPFVKFVAISGSVASEFAKEQDDIDLFIVVKNDTVWIYRLLIYIKNLFKQKIRSKEKSIKGKSVKDKLCINFLVEQRSLALEEDIFNFNELIYMKPIYNEEFKQLIFLNNMWIKDRYLVSNEFFYFDGLKVGDVKELTERNYFLFFINLIAFIGQLLFMIVMQHKPEISRLWKGFKKGSVEFYPREFKKEKLKDIKPC
jgi:predicted nucleotidyltransferase